jgi:hypothetical protein
MGTVASLSLGDLRRESVPVGIFGLAQASGLGSVEGFLSLGFFWSAPVTVDYPSRLLVMEDESSDARRVASGVPVPVEVSRDGPATDVHLLLQLPGGRTVAAEVDSGSDTLILDEGFAAGLGIDFTDRRVRKVSGADETGNQFTDISLSCPAISPLTARRSSARPTPM